MLMSPDIFTNKFSPINNIISPEKIEEHSYFAMMRFDYAELRGKEIYLSQIMFNVHATQQEEVSNSFKYLFNASKRNRVLEFALKNSWKMHRLSQDYSNLLEDNMPEENYNNAMISYEEVAKSYAFIPRNLSPDEIAYSAKVILEAIDEDLGSDDIADLLELDVMDVENALTQYSIK